MHTLSDAFLKPCGRVVIMGYTFFRFEIYFQSKVREYYAQSESEYETWIYKLNKVTGHLEITSKYDIIDKVGSGKFGTIHKVFVKGTDEAYCMKTVCKKNISQRDMEDLKIEVEVLKMCQHPNLVKLFDVIDSLEYMYIGK